jgi:S1-C subfamily serine protease
MTESNPLPTAKRSRKVPWLAVALLAIVAIVFFRGEIARWVGIDPRFVSADVGYVGLAWDGIPNPQAAYGVPEALRITRVVLGGPADQAGVKVGDTIVGLDGQSFSSVFELQRKVGFKRPGESITLDLVRGGAKLSCEMRLITHNEIVELSLKTPGDGIAL